MSHTRDTVLVLGTGATRGGGFRVAIGGRLFQPPLDRDFFVTPAVQSVFDAEDYPALHYYQQEQGLEAVWAKIDLFYKLSNREIISEVNSWKTCKQKMENKGENDLSYRLKMQSERPCLAVPSMALWELRNLTRSVYERLVMPPVISPLEVLLTPLIRRDRLKAVVSFNYDTSLEIILDNL